ncbi:MAG TPA: hypothetical protein DCZ94_06755 [Lentisphaeria bacterium]|nr:MAG: hypothetical protein A2X48_10635 [Lentisphaerae bacterium GWF2_49_21]HBC86635.1 hypothetical protein [Lentisphaeria bacterium]
MAENKIGEMESRISFVNYIGLAILLVCYVGALWNVYKIKEDELILKKKVIRLCHWQLELGIKDALEEMIGRYEKTHPDIKIIQIPVTERAYAQWVTTQLIGRTAPDLVELGFFDVKLYLGRYFQPITDELRQPNPYNKDNDFKDTPWMDTFTDGLQNSYIPELLDYYAVGFSQFTVRIFYNKTLMKKILERDDPPKTLEQLFRDCEKIQEYVKTKNAEVEAFNSKQSSKGSSWNIFSSPKLKSKMPLVPIASSRYQVGLFRTRYAGMLSADRCLDIDFGCDGSANYYDVLQAMLSGKLTLQDEKFRIYNELTRKLSSYFNPGFMSVDRMDAGFSFVQGSAVMITSGSWDASSYIKKINDQPFGDIIVSVNDKPVSNAADASRLMIDAARSGAKSVILHVNREGDVKKVTVYPDAKGETLWDSYGIKVEDCADAKGRHVPVVTELDSVSPAANAGMTRKRSFDVGIFDFPLPTKDDPTYGKYVVGRVVESTDTGFKFGITKFTEHKAECIDFFQFCTTPENNQKMNEIAQWIPAVKGAKPTKFLEAFVPNFRGYWGYLNFMMGSKTDMLEKQTFWPYVSGENDYAKYLNALASAMPNAAANDYIELIRKCRESVPDKQVFRSFYLAQYMFPESFVDAKAGNAAEMEKLAGKKRNEAAVKFVASWDNLVGFALDEMRIKAMMAPRFKDKDNNSFSKAFFSEYERLSNMSGGKK